MNCVVQSCSKVRKHVPCPCWSVAEELLFCGSMLAQSM